MEKIKFVGGLLCIILFIYGCNIESKQYAVEITFCDHRPKRVVYITSTSEPSRFDIDTHRSAVPKFRGYLNVCEVRVLN
jgi:hypothetical protein